MKKNIKKIIGVVVFLMIISSFGFIEGMDYKEMAANAPVVDYGVY